MNRGTGYVARSATWENGDGIVASFIVDPTAYPWGVDGGPYAKDNQAAPAEGAPLRLYFQRYAGGASTKPGNGWGIGAWGEALGENVEALKRWYWEQSAEHRAEWDGEPTIQEVYDAAFSNNYPSKFYGGGGDVLVDSAQAWNRYRFLLNGALGRGEISRVGDVWSITLVGDHKPTRFLIRWLPGGVADPPPPPVDDDDEDPPPPPVKMLSSVEQRVAELRVMVDETLNTFRSRFQRPWWAGPLVHQLVFAASEAGLLDLVLTEAVRAKRAIHGEVPR
jgi:hypothetical protein